MAINTPVSVEPSFNDAITKIGTMPAPFVKYCSTIWGIEFVDDNDWEVDE